MNTLMTLLTSALVSALVALGVEWAAKPRLEARKEHLLALGRARQQLVRCLSRMQRHAAVLAHRTVGEPDQDSQAAHDAIIRGTRDVEAAFFEVADLGGRYRAEVETVLARYVGAVQSVTNSDRTWTDQGQLIRNWTASLVDVLGAPGQPRLYWLRPLYRRHRERQLAALQDAFATELSPGGVE